MNLQTPKTVELKELLHRRVLLGEKDLYRNPSKIFAEEFKVLEISPSNEYIKLQNLDGKKYWKSTKDCMLLEVLNISEKPKNDE